MRYGRSPAFWVSLLIAITFMAFSLSAGLYVLYGVWVSLRFFAGFPPFLTLVAILLGLVFLLFPFYAFWSIFNRSVRHVDVNGSVTLEFLGGKEIQLEGIRSIFLRTGYRGLTGLVIEHAGGETEINAPYQFQDRRALFAALEKASGKKIA
jgi:hypothetical protein